MANLGEMLKAANEARALEKSKAEIAKREADRKKYERDDAEVRRFLERCKESFIEAIETGVTPKSIKIPTSAPFDTYSWTTEKGLYNANSKGTFVCTNHPHYSAFESFFTWADENGLIGRFDYEHDGMGMSSWYTVTVVPK